jgi:hypothetical protein
MFCRQRNLYPENFKCYDGEVFDFIFKGRNPFELFNLDYRMIDE